MDCGRSSTLIMELNLVNCKDFFLNIKYLAYLDPSNVYFHIHLNSYFLLKYKYSNTGKDILDGTLKELKILVIGGSYYLSNSMV